MPWIIGGSSTLSWSTARDKVRSDLWRKGSTAIPDDVVDRALHASILDIESRRKWLWLENVSGKLSLLGDNTIFGLPASCGAVQALSVFINTNPYSDPLELVPIGKLREMVGSARGYPSYYALGDGVAYLDCITPDGTQFELIFQAKCPDYLDDCVETPPITLARHQQAVLAGAKALIALEFLHDDAKAQRNSNAFEAHIRRMEDRDDQLRGSDRGGTIQPFTDIQDAAFGVGWSH